MEFLKYNNLKYILSLPEGYSKDEKYPLLVFLHGAGTRGNDISMLANNPFFTETGDNLSRFIVVAPQCNADSWFDVFEQLHDFICHMISDSNIDRARCYLMGASMGGYAVWQETMSHPELYAAVVPICGGGMYWNAGRMKHTKVWAFHGSDDSVVYPEESRKMVDAINRCGGDAELTVYDGIGHNVWLQVYRDKKVFEWLLHQKKSAELEEKSLYNNSEKFG